MARATRPVSASFSMSATIPRSASRSSSGTDAATLSISPASNASRTRMSSYRLGSPLRCRTAARKARPFTKGSRESEPTKVPEPRRISMTCKACSALSASRSETRLTSKSSASSPSGGSGLPGARPRSRISCLMLSCTSAVSVVRATDDSFRSSGRDVTTRCCFPA